MAKHVQSKNYHGAFKSFDVLKIHVTFPRKYTTNRSIDRRSIGDCCAGSAQLSGNAAGTRRLTWRPPKQLAVLSQRLKTSRIRPKAVGSQMPEIACPRKEAPYATNGDTRHSTPRKHYLQPIFCLQMHFKAPCWANFGNFASPRGLVCHTALWLHRKSASPGPWPYRRVKSG